MGLFNGSSKRAVYARECRSISDDGGMPHKIEVHKGYIIEVDGKAMQIPACMGWSCDANFHFFDSKADLHRILDAL